MEVTRESIIAALEAVSAPGVGVTENCGGAIMAYGVCVYWDDQDPGSEGWFAKLYGMDHETGIYQDGSEDGACIDDAEDLAYVVAHVAAQTAEMLAADDGEETEAELSDLLARLTPVDLVLVEGFKDYPHDKIEVYRESVGKPLLAKRDPNVVAVASDVRPPGLGVPVLDLDDADAVAAFIIRHQQLTSRVA